MPAPGKLGELLLKQPPFLARPIIYFPGVKHMYRCLNLIRRKVGPGGKSLAALASRFNVY
jgi:hypothetical protein